MFFDPCLAFLGYHILASLAVHSFQPGFNFSSDRSLDMHAGQALNRLDVASGVVYQRRLPHTPLDTSKPPVMTKVSEQPGAGGMGLALSNRNPISLGHLTKKETTMAANKATNFAPPSPTYQSMRAMGGQISPNIISHLHPDISPRKIHRLWLLLGGKDDKYWTSEDPPRVLRQRGVSGMHADSTYAADGNSMDGSLVRKASALNMTFRDHTGAQFLMPESQVQIFRNWLIEQATCEMDFIWKDLGSLYWPRWIRMGVCLTRLGSSCSWPPGMKCQPSGSKVLRLLNWNCEDSSQTDVPSAGHPRSLSRNARSLTQPAINLRQHLGRVQVSTNRPNVESFRYQPRHHYAQPSTATWGYYDLQRRMGRRDTEWPQDPSRKEEQRARRARRLIEKLSVTASGYRCSWQVQKYLISDKCTCSCA